MQQDRFIYLLIDFFFFTQTATNPVVNNSQAKRHPLTRGESLPTAKRKKMGKY